MKELSISAFVKQLSRNKINEVKDQAESLLRFSEMDPLRYKAGPFITQKSIEIKKCKKELSEANSLLSTLEEEVKSVEITTNLLEKLGLDQARVISKRDFNFLKKQEFAHIEENPCIKDYKLWYCLYPVPNKVFDGVRGLLKKALPAHLEINLDYREPSDPFKFSFELPVAPEYMVDRYRLLENISNNHYEKELENAFSEIMSQREGFFDNISMEMKKLEAEYCKTEKRLREKENEKNHKIDAYNDYVSRSWFPFKEKRLRLEIDSVNLDIISLKESLDLYKKQKEELAPNYELLKNKQPFLKALRKGDERFYLPDCRKMIEDLSKVKRRFSIALVIDYSILEVQYKERIKPKLMKLKEKIEQKLNSGGDPQLLLIDNVTGAVHCDRHYGGPELLGEKKVRDAIKEMYLSL